MTSQNNLTPCDFLRVSQLFILNIRGDRLVLKDYRKDIADNADAIFLQTYNSYGRDSKPLPGCLCPAWGPEAPPFFNVNGVNYGYLKRNNVFIVATSRWNSPPAAMLELLERVATLLKDYLAVISEDAIRGNFILVNEILDEIIDFGILQDTTTEGLHSLIVNQLPEEEKEGWAEWLGDRVTAAPSIMMGVRPKRKQGVDATEKAIGSKKKHEIFVNLEEKVSAVLRGTEVLSGTIEGSVVVKSFLNGNPKLRIGFNEDLGVGEGDRSLCHLDGCNFHECTDGDNFEDDKALTFIPPEGEFSLMTYRVSSSTGEGFRPPFTADHNISMLDDKKAELTLTIESHIEAESLSVRVLMPLPKDIGSLTALVEKGVILGQHQDWAFGKAQREFRWKVREFEAMRKYSIRIRMILDTSYDEASLLKELSPFRMTFEVPNANVTGLKVKALDILDPSAAKPVKWVRSLAEADSYHCRMA